MQIIIHRLTAPATVTNVVGEADSILHVCQAFDGSGPSIDGSDSFPKYHLTLIYGSKTACVEAHATCDYSQTSDSLTARFQNFVRTHGVR